MTIEHDAGKRKVIWDTEEIHDIIWMFASSQGFYGRIAIALDESDGWDELTTAINERGCTSILDIVLMLEGC